MGCLNLSVLEKNYNSHLRVLGRKSEQEKTGIKWLDYGARFYDPTIGRFTGVDPISDKFPHVSTYNYAENRVPNGIDLYGLQFLYFNSDAEFKEALKEGAKNFLKMAGRVGAFAGEIAAGLSPAGVAIDVKDFTQAAVDGDGLGMMLAGVGFLPGLGDGIKGVGKGLREFLGSGDELADGVKLLGDGKKQVRVSSEGSASAKFDELIEGAGGSLDDVKTPKDGVSTYTDADGRTITLRPSTEGQQTISTTLDDGRQLKIRFENE